MSSYSLPRRSYPPRDPTRYQSLKHSPLSSLPGDQWTTLATPISSSSTISYPVALHHHHQCKRSSRVGCWKLGSREQGVSVRGVSQKRPAPGGRAPPRRPAGRPPGPGRLPANTSGTRGRGEPAGPPPPAVPAARSFAKAQRSRPAEARERCQRQRRKGDAVSPWPEEGHSNPIQNLGHRRPAHTAAVPGGAWYGASCYRLRGTERKAARAPAAPRFETQKPFPPLSSFTSSVRDFSKVSPFKSVHLKLTLSAGSVFWPVY